MIPSKINGMVLVTYLISSLMSSGELIKKMEGLYKIQEELVFAYDARNVASKYSIRGLDPEKELSFSQNFNIELLRLDQNVGALEKQVRDVLESIKGDKSLTFKQVGKILTNCTHHQLGSVILAVDYIWPEKKGEIRTLVKNEISKRGPDADIEASLNRGWLLFQNERLTYWDGKMSKLLNANLVK